jgi:flagellar protein FlgJ
MNTIENRLGYGALTNGKSAVESAKISSEKGRFESLLGEMKDSSSVGLGISSSQVVEAGRVNGDWTSGFSGTYTSEADKNALPRGAAANQAGPNAKQQTIDRTSKLYEKSLELENYLVKQMLSEMRKTVMKANEDDNAKKIYEDMLFDEYATMMTKNAGFGLADQMYLQLSNGGANDNA